VTVTVCGIQESPLALAAIEPLPARTGGSLLFYTTETATQLPGDLYGARARAPDLPNQRH
jgi:hypothetical protein